MTDGRMVHDGVQYQRTKLRKTRLHVLKISLDKRSIRAVPATEQFPMWSRRTPPQLAKDAGAIACVGGGFMATSYNQIGVTGQPLHALAIDKEIWTTGIGRGGTTYVGNDGDATVAPGKILISVNGLTINHVNRGHEGNVAFTRRGGTNEMPHIRREHVRLRPSGPWEQRSLRWARPMRVMDHMPKFLSEEDIIIETDLAVSWEIDSTVMWTQYLGLTGGLNVVAGPTLLVLNGHNNVPALDLFGDASHGPDDWYIRPNPRTAIGVSRDQKTAYIAVAEGRVQGSRGYRLKEFASILIHEVGCWSAVNLDGGGSSHMWVKGEKNGGLVADSCYGASWDNGKPTGLPPDPAAVRPNCFATSVF